MSLLRFVSAGTRCRTVRFELFPLHLQHSSRTFDVTHLFFLHNYHLPDNTLIESIVYGY